MSEGSVPLPFEGAPHYSEPIEPPENAPCVYVATKITGTQPGSPERQIVEFGVLAIRDAVREATQESGDPWYLGVHAPVEWTAPEQTPEMSASDVFHQNARRVLGEADALIVYGWSPSAGVGQEITWAALSTGIPVLYLEPPGHQASRQIRGTPGDLTMAGHSTPESLKDEVRRWIRGRRHQIQANGSRRRDRAARLDPLRVRLSQVWDSIDLSERQRVSAHLGLEPGVISWWLEDVSFLATAPIAYVLLLSVALTGSTDLVIGRHRLGLRQIEALLAARDEQDWDEATTEALRRRGETELAQPGLRRLKLDSPEDWHRLKEATDP